MNVLKFIPVLILFQWIGAMAIGEEPNLPTYECCKTLDTIKVDGSFDEKTWRKALPMHFVLWNGTSSPRQETTVKMAWDATNLYLTFRVVDDNIQCKYMEHDENLWNEDVVEVFLDPGENPAGHFEFEWNALGAYTDLFFLNPPVPPPMKKDWEAQGMVYRTKKTTVGWQTEASIPFKSMAKKIPVPEDVWRMNLFRIDRGGYPREHHCWSPVMGKYPAFHRTNRFGYLKFVVKPSV